MANSSLLMYVAVGETRVTLTENGSLGELYVERRREREATCTPTVLYVLATYF